MGAPCIVADCGRPKHTRSTKWCVWHWLRKQPAGVQEQYADHRYANRALAEEVPRIDKRYWPRGERWCAGCQSYVPLFYVSGSRCRACASRAAHRAQQKRTYGLQGDDYDRLLAAQGGRCAICGAQPRTRRLATDHNHLTGAVRGLLCHRCNTELLPAASHDAELLESAAQYLRHHDAFVEVWAGAEAVEL